MTLRLVYLLFIASLVWIGAGRASWSQEASDGAIGSVSDSSTQIPLYRINPGDQLRILVYKVPDLARDIFVRPDGFITYPLAGDIFVKGKTLVEIRALLYRRLIKYIRQPEIEINLMQAGQQQIVVLGEVNAPGIYRFSGTHLSMAEVLALAKGYNTRAHLKSVMIVEGNPMLAKEFKRVNFHAFLKHHRMQENPLVPGGSFVYVPRTFIASINQFVDDVAGPAYRIGVTASQVNTAWKETTD